MLCCWVRSHFFQVYNCILRRFPADMYTLFHEGGNLYATTIFVLLSAVQKISRCTRIPEGTLLYRGLGGLLDLPDKFHAADEQGRSGYLDWGMMSTSSDRNVALGYSGMKQRRPRAMVMVIEATSVDRGADISEFSQYPGEKEFLWVPCSFVQRAQPGGGRVEVVDGGLVIFVPVRVNLNLKTETVEELLEKKKSMHVTAFEFRVNELRQRLLDEAKAGNADARLKNDKDDQGEYWEQEHSVHGYIEAQVAKVAAVLEKHRAREANDYSDDVVYRNLAAESLEAASMAQSALQLWLRDKLQNIDFIYDCSLLDLHRRFESFMKLRYTSADAQEDRSAAAVELCKVRNLMISDANEKDGNGEPLLVALAARGASGEDVELLIAAGADMSAVSDEYNESAMHLAGQQGHAELIRTLVRAGANYNQTPRNGSTPLWLSSFSGQLGSVKVLLEAKADVDQARTDEGGTPLSIACQHGHVGIVEALLGQRADMNKARTEDGVTQLFLACEEGHDSIVEALLGQKADVNQARTEDGSTPLLIACQEGHDNIVEALLGHRADVNQASTDDGSTPLHAACEEGHDSIVKALLGHRADVNQARTDDGSTPLYTACENHHTSCVRLLLHDPALSCEGKAPLALALEKGFADIAAVIEKSIA
jgi:ankyrin repeat protein